MWPSLIPLPPVRYCLEPLVRIGGVALDNGATDGLYQTFDQNRCRIMMAFGFTGMNLDRDLRADILGEQHLRALAFGGEKAMNAYGQGHQCDGTALQKAAVRKWLLRSAGSTGFPAHCWSPTLTFSTQAIRCTASRVISSD